MGDVTQATVDGIISNATRAVEPYTFAKTSLINKSALSAMVARFDNEIIKQVFIMETGEPPFSREPSEPVFDVPIRAIENLQLCRDAMLDAFERAQELSPDDDELKLL